MSMALVIFKCSGGGADCGGDGSADCGRESGGGESSSTALAGTRTRNLSIMSPALYH